MRRGLYDVFWHAIVLTFSKTFMKNKPIQDKRDVRNHPDEHIDQDFKGYPDGPAKDETIRPKTKEEKKSAAVNVKDGEKMFRSGDENKDDGSANAFERTEEVNDDE